MSKQGLNLFEQYLFEAPGDEAPDAGMSADESQPPTTDTPTTTDSADPPVIDGTPDDTATMDTATDAPPELGDDTGGGDDFGVDDFGGDDTGGDDAGNEAPQNQVQGLDSKVSAIMNHSLYQRYLTLLTQITSQLTSIRNNSDILYSITADTAGIVKSLTKLEDNIRAYLKDFYINNNYTRNLLFFNKCLNLLNLINKSFDQLIRTGIEDQK